MKPRGFLPFHPRFTNAVHDGAKTFTARRKRYGSPGDALLTPFGPVVLVAVRQEPLGVIAAALYQREGLRSPREFIDVWNELHPEAEFRAEEVVWLHEFRLANPGEVGGTTHA